MRRLLLLILFHFPVFLPAQDLLMNGSFEEENICTEYEKNCAPEGWISTSLFADYYFDDAASASEGSHFVGLTVADGNRLQDRNFLRSRLLCGLRRGAQYRIEFFIRSRHAVFDSIGIYFSANDFLYQKEKLRNSRPQLLLKETDSLAPSNAWQKVVMNYTASGDENFISIGDFKKGPHSTTGMPDLGRDYYFFIDKISLKPLKPSEKLCAEWSRLKEDEYDFNVRHSQLDKLVYVYTKRPPVVEAAPKTVVQRIDTLVIPDVFFATNSYALQAGAKEVLDGFVARVKSIQIDSVIVEGHTDSKGSVVDNQQLSQNRATSVASYLQPHFSQAMFTKAFASEKPVADNRTVEGRRKNRRVEIYVYVRE